MRISDFSEYALILLRKQTESIKPPQSHVKVMLKMALASSLEFDFHIISDNLQRQFQI